MSKASALVALAAAFLLGGCVGPTTQRVEISAVLAEEEAKKQKAFSLRTVSERARRLEYLTYPLLIASTEICEEEFVGYRLGFGHHSQYSYEPDWRTTAIEEFGVGKAASVAYVVPDSPAYRSGLEVGDVLISFDEENLPVDPDRRKLDAVYNRSIEDGVVNVSVLRGDERLDLRIQAEELCNYPVTFADDDEINAYADGSSVVLTKGMMRFANDEELSLVIAHEIAHNIMKHIEAKTVNALGGTLLDVIIAGTTGINPGFGNIAALAHSQEFEIEADYVGIYILARAGQEIDNAANFWRRIGAENPSSVSLQRNVGATHPSSPERYVAIENAIAEVKRKIANGEPLRPNLKQ